MRFGRIAFVVAALVAVSAAMLWGPRIRTWLAIDGCLDRGGRWVEGACDMGDSSAVRDSTILWPERRVVLNASGLAPLLEDCWDKASRERVTGTWTPSADQIEMADSVVADYLRSPEGREEIGSMPIALYGRQFVGLRYESDSVIYVNGFDFESEAQPPSIPLDTTRWKREIVCVHGGGAIYFNATVHPASATLESLYFNSPM